LIVQHFSMVFELMMICVSSSRSFDPKKFERVASLNDRPDRAVTVESRRLGTPVAPRREWFKCSQISVRGIIEPRSI